MSQFSIVVRVVLLPLALGLSTVAGLGSYCETSDDVSLAWLFSGVLARQPVASVPLYFHGYGQGLAAAYTVAPGVPWMGLLLSGLLALATGLTFAVLDTLLRPHLRAGLVGGALVVFFGVAWVEHWLWFSHGRVALLLAEGAVLYAAQRPGRRGPLLLGLAALGAAWGLRPGLALLGAGAAVPAALLLAGGWRRAAPLLLSAALGLAGATGAAALRQTPAEAQTQARDGYLARVLDFGQLRPHPRTPADSLGTAAVGMWLLGDTTVVNEALGRRVYRFDAADFLRHEVPAKLAGRALLLGRDYFPLLLALAATAIGMGRRRGRQGWFWLVQLGFIGALGLLAGLLKLPPRLALPLLDCWLLTNLAFWLQAPAPSHPAAPGVPLVGQPQAAPPRSFFIPHSSFLILTVLLYGAKTLHRRQVLGQERRRHEQALAAINRAGAGRVCILAGANELLKSLSPFRTYTPGTGPLLVLTGWPAHDPSQGPLRRALSGTTDQTECLRRLAVRAAQGPPRPAPLWVLTPETAAWLSRRFRFSGAHLRLIPTGLVLPTDSTLYFYRVFH